MIFSCLFKRLRCCSAEPEVTYINKVKKRTVEPNYSAFITAKVLTWAIGHPDNVMHCPTRIWTELRESIHYTQKR